MRTEDVPIEHGRTKWTSLAGASEEIIPDGIGEGGRLGIAGERYFTRRTTQRERYDLALGLTCFNIRCHERTVCEIGAWEQFIIELCMKSAIVLCVSNSLTVASLYV
jgi:hypothetical protein